MIGGIYFAGAAFAGVVGTLGPLPAPETGAGIILGGVEVTARVRVAGVTIRDILNDAPNTCTFTLEGDGPAVGQSVRVASGPRVLFTGSVQTIDQAFESKPEHLAWYVTAIDDTAAANARRPFGTWFDTSATTIAQSLTTTFAPGFSTAGIEAGLPAVTIVFDGADPFIACLARLATAVGGYCKIEERTVYLFQEDTSAPPDPIDAGHRFLMAPPVTVNTDASQLRTRDYGKGYGETVTADIAVGETLLPIQDGVLFPPLGGTAIVGVTADGAQSEPIAFTSVVRPAGGSLVGTGAAPGSPPGLELVTGSGVDSGVHTMSVSFVTAAGQSLAGPAGSITAGIHPPPAAAPTPGIATNGSGPDQGNHDYAVSFVTAYGETVAGPISSPVSTSATVGELPVPSAPSAGPALAGSGMEDGKFEWAATFVNAQGETTLGYASNLTETKQVTTYPPSVNGTVGPVEGGSLTLNTSYYYTFTFTVTGGGETLAGGAVTGTTNANYPTLRAMNLGVFPGGGPGTDVTGTKIYRSIHGQFPQRLVATASIGASIVDGMSDAAAASQPALPTVDTSGKPYNQVQVSGIPIGPAGTTGRRLYRRNLAGPAWFRQVTSIGNNTATTYLDTRKSDALTVDPPPSNGTGTAVQRVPVTNIPLGPAGVTARKLYRRFNGAGTFKLVTTIANNTGTSFTDNVSNAALGASALGTATAVANQILATIPTGPAAVTARYIYMSPVGSSVRHMIGGFTDNTTRQVVIQASDAIITTGVLEPIADTSGLQQPNGQVNPGSTVLPVAASTPFRGTGGWVTLGGGQVVRYTGISGQTLTGIPASGAGSITTTVMYGSQAIPAPMLVGVTGIGRPMQKGSGVHIWIQRDDLAAQAEHAARTGGDGIVEFLIVDNRRGVDSLIARCDADLALFSRPIVTVGYATRDLKTKSGKPIVIDLPSQRLQTTLTIQEVTITEIGLVPGLAPRFTVKAASVRFSLEDTLRRLMGAGPVVGGST